MPKTIFCCPNCGCTDITTLVVILVNATPDDLVRNAVVRDEGAGVFECPECADDFPEAHEVNVASKRCLTCHLSHKIHKFLPEDER